MNACPNCDYNKNRAARWRAEAYKQAGHDVIELPWVGLTVDEILSALESVDPETKRLPKGFADFAYAVEAKLKEKNCG
jgi:hypothetical protein